MVVSIPLDVVFATAEEMDVSMAKEEIDNMGKEVDEVDQEASEEVVEEVTEHMQIGLTYHISPVTFEDEDWVIILNEKIKRITEYE